MLFRIMFLLFLSSISFANEPHEIEILSTIHNAFLEFLPGGVKLRAERDPIRELKIASEALNPLSLSLAEWRTFGAGQDFSKMAVQMNTEEERIRKKFSRMKILKMPRAQKRLRVLADRFLFFLQKAEDAQTDRSMFIRKALEVYEDAVLQVYRVRWTRKTLRKFLIEKLEGSGHLIAPSTLAGIASGSLAAHAARTPAVIGFLAALVTYFSCPHSLFGALVTASSSALITNFLASRAMPLVVGLVIGVIVAPVYRFGMIRKWKKENPTPEVPVDLIFQSFWGRIEERGYTLSEKSTERVEWITRRLERAAGKRLCEIALSSATI